MAALQVWATERLHICSVLGKRGAGSFREEGMMLAPDLQYLRWAGGAQIPRCRPQRAPLHIHVGSCVGRNVGGTREHRQGTHFPRRGALLGAQNGLT